MADKKYKLTCPAINFEMITEAENENDAEVNGLSEVGMNIHEYIKVDVEEVTKWNQVGGV